MHKDLRVHPDALLHWPKCDGLIVAGVPGAWFDVLRQRSGHSIACSGSVSPDVCHIVALDDAAAGALAADHFRDCRIPHFAYYGLQSTSTVAGRRLAGFREALAARGQRCDECPVAWPSELDFLTHAHHPKLVEWLRGLPKPVGVLCSDDTVAHDLATACVGAGMGVPDPVAILGVNNDDLLCESAWPPLSSIDCDYSRMGYAAARLLDRLLAGTAGVDEERATYFKPIGVVQRQSTNTLALDSPELIAVIRYVREHACDPCSVGDIVRKLPVTRRWLENEFRTRFGHTPLDEITRARIDTAKKLLLARDIGLPEIAGRCGYGTLQSFERAFRRVEGLTPAAWRRAAVARGRG